MRTEKHQEHGNNEQSMESASIGDIIERYQRQVYYLALDLCGNHDDAEDLAQDVFVKVYHSLASFRGDAKLSSWMYRITVNTFIDKSRKKSFAASKVNENYDDERSYYNDASRNRSLSPEDKAASELIRKHVDAALDVLSPQERSVFVLRHYNNRTLKEIAEILGNSEGSVKSLLFRAVQKLRKSLAFYRKELGLEEKS